MNGYIVTRAIVLSRINFHEADRIVSVITPDSGKLSLIAKGSRKPRSKLAGGIELFSINEISVRPGKSDIKTLTSSRLEKPFSNIVTDYERTMLAYKLLKLTNRNTEVATESEYFWLIEQMLESLDDLEINITLIELWFTMQLLRMSGHAPDLKQDTSMNLLNKNKEYLFDVSKMAFYQHSSGVYGESHIKLLRLAMSTHTPAQLKAIVVKDVYLSDAQKLSSNILKANLRV